MTVFAGLDVHKKYFHATVMDNSGEVLVQEDFPNETEGYDSLLAKTGEEVKVAIKVLEKPKTKPPPPPTFA